MAICALEVCTAALIIWIDVPAAASLVRYQRSSIGGGHPLCERGIFEDGLESILN